MFYHQNIAAVFMLRFSGKRRVRRKIFNGGLACEKDV